MSKNDPTRTAEQRLYQVYGLTVSDFLGLWDACEGKCQICSVSMHSRWVDGDNGDRSTRCNVDHCHETGDVRGLLCTACNTALGKLDDDIDRLNAAISYLQSPFVGFGNPEKETLKQRQLREEENAMRLLGYYKDKHGRFHPEGQQRRVVDRLKSIDAKHADDPELSSRAFRIRSRILSNDKGFRPSA